MNPLESEDGVFIFGTPDEDDQLKFYSQDFEPDEKKILYKLYLISNYDIGLSF